MAEMTRDALAARCAARLRDLDVIEAAINRARSNKSAVLVEHIEAARTEALNELAEALE